MATKTLNILGAGKLGTTLARLARLADYQVTIANTQAPEALQWILDVVAPGAEALPAKAVVASPGPVVLALPLSHYRQLDPAALADRVVFDAMNYWAPVDGQPNTISSLTTSSSEVVQQWLAASLVVKAFNHMGYHDLEVESERPSPTRRVMAFATDHVVARQTATTVIEDLGLAPYDLGDLRFGLQLEPGSPLFGAALDEPAFTQALGAFYASPFGEAVLQARGRIR